MGIQKPPAERLFVWWLLPYLPEYDGGPAACADLFNRVICGQVSDSAYVALAEPFLLLFQLSILPLTIPVFHDPSPFIPFWIDYSLRTSGKRSADRHPQALGEGVEYFFSIASCFRCNYIIESNRNQILYG